MIQSIIRTGSGSFILTWSASSGSTYRVEYKDSLKAQVWTDLTPDVVADHDTACFTDYSAPGAQRFDRIAVVR